MADPTDGHSLRDYGGHPGHAIFHWWIRWLGVGPSYVLLLLVVPYYVIFRPTVRRATSFYLRRRFPGQSRLRLLPKTIRHINAFARILIDHAAMGILGPERFAVAFSDAEELYRLAGSGKGLVLLTTHAGCWRSAMANMGALEVPIHFQFELEGHTAGRHFFELAGQANRFHLVSPAGFLGGMVELANALHAGECVAVMGDRAWGGKTQTATFLGDSAPFPISGYHLALATGAEVVVLLTARVGKCAYRIEHTCITEGLDREALSREEAITELLRRYVACLEDYLDRYPFMWFNFFDFWREEQENAR